MTPKERLTELIAWAVFGMTPNSYKATKEHLVKVIMLTFRLIPKGDAPNKHVKIVRNKYGDRIVKWREEQK